MMLIDFLTTAAAQIFWVVYEGALFILLGFAIAGLVHVLLDPERIVRHLGARSLRSAALAAVIGAPLPLCSCGVLPMAVSLRRGGASREATLAFLITTPETGVDSLAMTFAYCGPWLAIIRPIVAIATGLVAASFSLRQVLADEALPVEAPLSRNVADKPASESHAHHSSPVDPNTTGLAWIRARAQRGVQYAFVDLFDELGFWLVLTIALTGVLAALLPADFFVRAFPSSFAAMLVVVLLGAPLYVCASASTPLAALLLAKGATAGTALVFLLVGPATNAATLATVHRMLGGRAVRLYLGSILIVALTAGLMLDLLAPGVAAVHIGVPPDEFASLALVKLVAAFVFGMLLLASLQRTGLRSGWHQLAENGSAVLRWARSVSLKDARRTLALRVVVALWLVSLLAGTFWRVPIGQQALVQRLGRLVGPPRGAGPAFVAPFTDRIDLVAVDEMRERAIGYRLRPGTLVREPLLDEALHLTADENVVDLRAEAQYRVRDAVRYRLGVEAPDDVLAALARARLVEAMAGRPIDSVYTDTRAAVERWLLRRVRHDAEMAHLGIEVVAVRLLDVHAPAAVHDAFRDVASAHEDRLTTIHLANEYAASIVAVGRGDAARITAEAEGFAAERRARAKGDANAFAALATAHRQSPRATEDRLYIEAAERVLPGARKIVRPAGGTAASVDLWLRGGPSAELFPSSPPETVVEGSGSTAKEWSPWPKEHRQ